MVSGAGGVMRVFAVLDLSSGGNVARGVAVRGDVYTMGNLVNTGTCASSPLHVICVKFKGEGWLS